MRARLARRWRALRRYPHPRPLLALALPLRTVRAVPFALLALLLALLPLDRPRALPLLAVRAVTVTLVTIGTVPVALLAVGEVLLLALALAGVKAFLSCGNAT